MPELDLSIGGRVFRMACQPGEEAHLRRAATLLDAEAAPFSGQSARMPEAKLLLVAGLMLADRFAAQQDQAASLSARVAALEAEVAALQARPAPAPERVEVPVVPKALMDRLAELAAEAEAIADVAEERAGELADMQFGE